MNQNKQIAHSVPPLAPGAKSVGSSDCLPPAVAQDGASVLTVSMTVPKDGWIRISVPLFGSDGEISATHLEDPFPRMIAWLEQISEGADEAAWRIDDEASSARLIWLGKRSLGAQEEYLICWYSYKYKVFVKSAAVQRQQMVGAFYQAFRDMVERAEYAPFHWERDGSRLRELRSKSLERYLAVPEN